MKGFITKGKDPNFYRKRALEALEDATRSGKIIDGIHAGAFYEAMIAQQAYTNELLFQVRNFLAKIARRKEPTK